MATFANNFYARIAGRLQQIEELERAVDVLLKEFWSVFNFPDRIATLRILVRTAGRAEVTSRDSS